MSIKLLKILNRRKILLYKNESVAAIVAATLLRRLILELPLNVISRIFLRCYNGVATFVVGNLLQEQVGNALDAHFVVFATAGAFRQNAFSELLGMDDAVRRIGPNAYPAHVTRHGYRKCGTATFCVTFDSDRKIISYDFVDSHMNLHPFKGPINLASAKCLA